MEDRNSIEYLQQQMDLKRVCSIRFRSVDGGISDIRGHIIKLDSVSGRYMIETDAGLTIGVDQLVSVNGKSFENYC